MVVADAIGLEDSLSSRSRGNDFLAEEKRPTESDWELLSEQYANVIINVVVVTSLTTFFQ